MTLLRVEIVLRLRIGIMTSDVIGDWNCRLVMTFMADVIGTYMVVMYVSGMLICLIVNTDMPESE